MAYSLGEGAQAKHRPRSSRRASLGRGIKNSPPTFAAFLVSKGSPPSQGTSIVRTLSVLPLAVTPASTASSAFTAAGTQSSLVLAAESAVSSRLPPCVTLSTFYATSRQLWATKHRKRLTKTRAHSCPESSHPLSFSK